MITSSKTSTKFFFSQKIKTHIKLLNKGDYLIDLKKFRNQSYL